MKGITVYHYALSYDDYSISVSIVHYNFPQMLDIAINIYFTLTYYAGIMLNAFNDLLCSNYADTIGRSLVATIQLNFE